MTEEFFPDERFDKKRLRSAASTVGVMLILFNVLSIAALYMIVIVFYAFMNHSLVTNSEELGSAINFYTHYNSNMSIIANELCQLISIAVTIGIIAHFYKFKPLEAFRYGKKGTYSVEEDAPIATSPFFKNKATLSKIILVFFPIVISINYATSYIIGKVTEIIEKSGVNVYEADFSFNNLRISTLIFYGLSLCVFAPLIEEFLLRGCVIKILRPFGTKFAIFVSALFFAILHGNMGQGFGAFFIGLILGYIAVETGSIIPTMILHGMNNFFLYLGYVSSNFPNNKTILVTLGLSIIFLLLVGLYQFLRYKDDFKLENSSSSVLSKGKVYATFFLNIFVIIYLIYEIWELMGTFSK